MFYGDSLAKFSKTSAYEFIERYCVEMVAKLIGDRAQRNKYATYMGNSSPFSVWKDNEVNKLSRMSKENPLRCSVAMFSTEGDKIFSGFLRDRYGGSIDKAINGTSDFDELFDQFEDYFKLRRSLFMQKTTSLIDEQKKKILSQNGHIPSSYGGVANLLKVLTKTMMQQGANIQSIAKMQYTICLQAGIYVPDEFITDVLTAVDIENG